MKTFSSIGMSRPWAAQEKGCCRLGLEDFARLFGASERGFSDHCRALVANNDFRYVILDGEDREKVLLAVLQRLDSGDLAVAGRDAKARWEKGWAENLESFLDDQTNLASLVPKYIHPGMPLRLEGNYIMPVDPLFELRWFEVFREWLFEKYLPPVSAVYEFGCGTGYNLVRLAQKFPAKRLFGMDWAESSRDLVDHIAASHEWNMKGLLFDFFSPDSTLALEHGSAVLTFTALEQMGRDYGPFLDYLLGQQPGICIHVEPICEWYDENDLADYMAIRFHQRRKYLDGFITKLDELERQGKIEILSARRSHFGSLYIEAYSQVVWRPVS